jgi:hypothetical protein
MRGKFVRWNPLESAHPGARLEINLEINASEDVGFDAARRASQIAGKATEPLLVRAQWRRSRVQKPDS